MKTLALLFTCLLMYSVSAQDDESLIRDILMKQQDCWNAGDIDCFMENYWQSPDLVFIGKSGLTYGWEKTLSNYKKNYPTQAEMGTLKFELKYFERLAADRYFVIGSWNLTREVGDVGGHFSLVWRKIDGEWVIVADHSS